MPIRTPSAKPRFSILNAWPPTAACNARARSRGKRARTVLEQQPELVSTEAREGFALGLDPVAELAAGRESAPLGPVISRPGK